MSERPGRQWETRPCSTQREKETAASENLVLRTCPHVCYRGNFGPLPRNRKNIAPEIWPRGSMGVKRYGCIPRSAANNLGEIPKNWELQISWFEEFLGGENVLGLVPASLPHTLGYACTFYAPTSPSPRNSFWPRREIVNIYYVI